MKIDRTTRYPAALKLAIGVLIATCVFTTAANALPSFAGRFTLPHAVQWDHAVLPAGDYFVRMNSAAGPAMITSASGGWSVYAQFQAIADREAGGTYLTITTLGNQRKVRSLNLPELRKLVIFSPLTKTEREEFAKAGQINTVPVVTAKK